MELFGLKRGKNDLETYMMREPEFDFYQKIIKSKIEFIGT